MPPSSLPPPAKKRKLARSTEASSASHVEDLENQVVAAVATNGSLNSLADLLDITLTSSEVETASKGIYALYRSFVTIISSGNLSFKGDENAKVVRAWIWEKLNGYVEYLGGLLKDTDKGLRTSSLQILFSLLKHLSTSLAKSSTPTQPQFHASHFKKIVHALLICPPSPRSHDQTVQVNDGKVEGDVRDMFVETWLSVYDDVRWFFLREAASLLGSTSIEAQKYSPLNLLSFLERLVTFPTEQGELNSWWIEELGTKPPKPKRSAQVEDEDEEEQKPDDSEAEDDWRKFFDEDTSGKDSSTTKKASPSARLHKLSIHQSLHSLPAHRAVFTRAWLVLLPRLSSGSAETRKAVSIRVLNLMHRGILPHLTRPILVMDWVSSCVDYGGVVGLLALNALFILMQEYNLDYPSFYTRLYAFLDRDVLHLKHRARFFRMTELFLSSTHLPATLLASFIKRLSRLSISAPPAAIIMLVPFTYNILKRHPALMAMIHRPEDMESDPFLPDEPNPNSTHAIDSSLWELYSHRNHYHSAVSTLVRLFEEAFTKPGYSMEDFLDHTYSTLFEAEVKMKMKKEPVVEADLKNPLFRARSNGETEQEIEVIGDVVNELWVFSQPIFL
ncbi:hypothetical protein JAAARDRAFT_433296 [Jaapia argillacea MUCL 33604]|uniref:CCAAT-binding factor domain-containing protein n=1 Tax=Jaapia argillacea MUCL 33604 TaxID=933084 RepID=A0A067PEJ9_9AGAM|nr:hypothetical protein JAAARDRAFT_433296 [Jaapia argillacea MUCL 33604]